MLPSFEARPSVFANAVLPYPVSPSPYPLYRRTRANGAQEMRSSKARYCQGVRMHRDSDRADLAPKVAEDQGK